VGEVLAWDATARMMTLVIISVAINRLCSETAEYRTRRYM